MCAAPVGVCTHQASAVRRIETVIVGPRVVEWLGQELATLSMPRRLVRSNSLSPRSALIIERSSHEGFAAGCDAQEVLGDGGSPLGEPRRGEGSPTRLERAVEHVAVAEVLDQKTVGIAPVVEDLAALDVAADSPGAVIAEVGEVAAAGGHRVDVADLVGRMDVTVGRAQRHCQGVVVGRGLRRDRSG